MLFLFAIIFLHIYVEFVSYKYKEEHNIQDIKVETSTMSHSQLFDVGR